MTKDDATPFDLRVYFFLLLSSSIAGLYARNEGELLALFTVTVVWKFLSRQITEILSLIFVYAGLWGITRIGFNLLAENPDIMIAAFMSNTGVSCRKAILPLVFTMILANQPTGSLIAAFSAMKLPKHFGIGIAVMLRFFPTLKQEFRAIREAQKFRGIGAGFWNTLLHIPGVMTYIIIPLTIRITRISDELSASVTVRGVRFNNEIISFRSIRFTKKDCVAICISLIIQASILIIDFTE